MFSRLEMIKSPLVSTHFLRDPVQTHSRPGHSRPMEIIANLSCIHPTIFRFTSQAPVSNKGLPMLLCIVMASDRLPSRYGAGRGRSLVFCFPRRIKYGVGVDEHLGLRRQLEQAILHRIRRQC
jgi:hypothetical protein